MDEEYRYKKKIKDDVDYPAYCYFFISKGYSTRIPAFKRYVVEGGHDILYYRFTIGKLVNCDDLPF